MSETETKNPWGRPPKFNSVEELEQIISKYFDSISEERQVGHYNKDNEFEPTLNKLWEPIYSTYYHEIPSILWMCEYIWIHRDTLLEYEKKTGFSDTIKKYKARVERYNADSLFREKNVTGIIFNLKNNFGWEDKIVNDNTNTNYNKDVSEMSDEELKNLTK